MKDLVVIENNQALTDSRIVAEKFGKNHKHVIRDIENLIKQTASVRQSPILGFGVNTPTSQMFLETTYQAEDGGRKYPMYLMNRDGFSLLAMGFTGVKALQFKLKFIDACNETPA